MDFRNLDLRIKYRSSDDDVVHDFFVPVLSNAVLYKRAVGYFSSTALIEVSRGLYGMIKNGGRVLLVASPVLSEKDIEAINKGYEERERVIEEAILNSFSEPQDYFEEERLNFLAHLIANGQLDIKIAFLENEKRVGLYHEKIGLIYDNSGNKMAFTGSLNESTTAFTENFESIDVFFSWKNSDNYERVMEKERDFDLLWENRTNKINVIEFPKVAKEKLNSYYKPILDYEIDEKEPRKVNAKKFPCLPKSICFYDYQTDAVVEWEKKGYKGIFNMATGTGKTLTGLYAITRLSNKLNKRLFVIIVCPYQHLVEQWVGDIRLFNMEPIVGYSSSQQRNWRSSLKNAVLDFNLEVVDHFCFVTTNATYMTDFVQQLIKKLKGNVVFVVDEAHNFGATQLSTKLNKQIPYRLALSATFERFGDPEGTTMLYDYFGEECINYSLERAIREKKLTPYYYYPILTWLAKDELDEYKKISLQLAKCYMQSENGNRVLNEVGKKLAIKRARLVAGSINKLYELSEVIKKYKDETHILVYCGATTISDIDYIEGKSDKSELRQIAAVCDILGNQNCMKVAQFTSEESAKEREIIKKEFELGDCLQALVAIRCLDEGVNIPKIKTAFILASSTNPKEYIQRRGRVLRLASGKDFAVIYDFVTVPRSLDEVKNLTESETKHDISLVKREIERMGDFGEISLNPQDADKLIKNLEEIYDLNKIRGGCQDGF